MSEAVNDFFARLGACSDGAEWAKGAKTLRKAWETCQRSDWMLWGLLQVGYKDGRILRLYACACVRGTPISKGRTVWDLLTDERSRKAVEVAERFAIGEATEEERAAAAAAAAAAATAAAATAYTASAAASAAAAYAAAAAAYAYAYAVSAVQKNARLWQADLLRQWISWEEVERSIKTYKSAKGEGR